MPISISEMLREVQEGETFVVTSRGRPVAKVMPVSDTDRQAGEIDALLAFVTPLPRRTAAGWRREDLSD